LRNRVRLAEVSQDWRHGALPGLAFIAACESASESASLRQHCEQLIQVVLGILDHGIACISRHRKGLAHNVVQGFGFAIAKLKILLKAAASSAC